MDDFFPTNSLVQAYRKTLEGQGKIDPRTDLELTVELGNQLRHGGDFETELKYPDFRSQYLDATQNTGRGLAAEARAGLNRGARGLGATAIGATALGAHLVGATDTAKSLAGSANEIEQGGPAPSVARLADVRDLGTAAKYAAGKAGEVFPSIAEAILTSMIGAAAGTAAEPGGGTAAGAAVGLVGRNAIKQMIRSGIAKQILGKEVAEAGVEAALKAGTNKLLQKEFVGAARGVAARMGGEFAAGINSLALSAGEIYNATGDPGLSVGAGIVAAIPDTIIPAYVMRKFFPVGKVTKEAAAEAKGYFGRLLADVAKTIPIEAGTEAFQEVVNIAAEKYKAGAPIELNARDWERIREAGVGGAFGGALAGPVAAIPGHEVLPQEAPPAAANGTAEAARRRAATATPAARPAAPKPAVQAAVLMTPDQQRVRLDALEKVSTRTKDEENELQVLRAALGVPAPAPVVAQPAPIVGQPAPIIGQPTPSPAPAAAPNVAIPGAQPSPAPAPFVGASSAPAAPAPAPSPLQLSQRVQAAGRKLMAIVNQVPTLDVSPVQDKLMEIGEAGSVNVGDVTALEAALTELEAKAGTEAATRAADKVAKKKIVAEAKDRKAAAALERLVEKATKKAEAPAPAPVEAPAAPVPPAPAPAPTDNLSERLDAALNPPAAPAANEMVTLYRGEGTDRGESIWKDPRMDPLRGRWFTKEKAAAETFARDNGGKTARVVEIQLPASEANKYLASTVGVPAPLLNGLNPNEVYVLPHEVASKALVPGFTFGKVTLDSADLRPVLTQDEQGNPRQLTPEAVKKVNWEKTLDVTGALGDSGDRSKTRIGVALLTPDGRILVRGLSRYNKAEGLKRAGKKGTGKGPAVQGMGLLKGKLKENKVVDPAGKQMVLLNDVVAAGYVPIARINFEGQPGVIRQDFATQADFDKAWNATEKVKAKGAKVSEAAGHSTLSTEVFNQGDAALAQAAGGNVAGAVREPTAEEAAFAAQAAKPKVIVRKVTKKLSAAVEKAVGKKRLKELKAATQSQPIAERSRIINHELETNADLAKAGDSGLVEAALHRLLKPDGLPGKERGSSPRGDGGGKLQRPRPAGAGIALPNVGGVPDAFIEGLHQRISAQGAGRFDADFLSTLSGTNQDRVTKVFTRTGLEWPEFAKRIQAAFDTAENPVDFAALLKGEPARLENAEARPAWQAREQRSLQLIMARLQNAGINVDLVAKELLGPRSGSYNTNLRRIRLAAEDIANANLSSLITLIHEVGHDIVASANPKMQAALHVAAERLLPSIGTIANSADPEERMVETFSQRLVEEGFGAQASTIAQSIGRTIKDLYLRVAMALQRGLGLEPNDALALKWFENNLRRLIGGDFDYRYTDMFRTLLPESITDRVQRFTRVDGPGVVNFLDPLTRSLRQPIVAPDTVEAIEWNSRGREETPAEFEKRKEAYHLFSAKESVFRWMHGESRWKFTRNHLENAIGYMDRAEPRQDEAIESLDLFKQALRDKLSAIPDGGEAAAKVFNELLSTTTEVKSLRDALAKGDALFEASAADLNRINSGEPELGRTPTPEMDYTEAMARTTGAAWNELLPLLVQLKQDLGPTLTDAQFWKLFAKAKDQPTELLQALEARVPDSSNAKIAGDKMTEAMNQRARYFAFSTAQSLAAQARGRAASATERGARAAAVIGDKARRVNKMLREFRDAAAMNAAFNDSLKDLLKNLTVDLDRGANTGFAAGKLLGAIREMEKLQDDEAIPAEYQRVFKHILDADNNSLFEYVSGIARLDLPLKSLKVPEIVDEIKKNAEGNAHLQALVKNKPLLVALASLAKQSTSEMDLLQLRVMNDNASYLAIKQDMEQIRAANEDTLETLAKGWKIAQGNQGLRDRLRLEFITARREFNNLQRIIRRSEENGLIAKEIGERLTTKAVDLSRDVGAFSYWEAANGATYRAMALNDAGEWTSTEKKLRMVGPDISDQFEPLRHDLRSNNLWLEQHKDKAGSRIYEEVKRQTEELNLLDINRQTQAAHRFFLDKMLQPIGQKFASTGKPSGVRIQQQLLRYQHITRTHADEIEALSRKWTHAAQAASEAAGYAYYKQFFQEILTPVIYEIESQPGLEEAAALREAGRAAKRRIPGGFKVADDFQEKLAALLRHHFAMSERLLKIAEDNGVYIEDARITDPLTKKENLLRHAIKYGWGTSTRKLRMPVIQTLVHDMQKAGWNDELFTELDAKEMDEGQFQELIDTYFPRNIRRDFVEPFVNKPGAEVFFGPSETPVTQLEVQAAWENTGGDLLQFIDQLFTDKGGEEGDEEGKNGYRLAMLRRFLGLYTMESKIAAEAAEPGDPLNPFAAKPHRLMDGRTNDLIPPEHFDYDVFDPLSAHIALSQVAYHGAFGRGGRGLKSSINDLESHLAEQKREYDSLPVGSAKLKREAAEAHGWNFKELERAARDWSRIQGWTGEIAKYFGGGAGGAIGDEKAFLEAMRLNMSLVLNQPKSGLWNLLSLGDFPIAFRGLSRASLKASAWALQNLSKNVFGSALEFVGINIIKASEYSLDIGTVFDNRQTERLPWGVMTADIGKGGQFQEGGLGMRTVQGARKLQQAMKKGVKLGPGQGQFAGFSALWAPFNFINQQVASAISTANVQVLEMIIARGIKYFAEHPEAAADPAFRFTAEHLGMKGAFSWFSDEGAFDFFRTGAMDYRIGALEDIARAASGRQARGERILTRNEAMGAALMAMNEISLESSINSRPVEMFNNPVLRAGGLLLGWPLQKMNQVNQSLKTKEGQVEALSVLKGIGVLAAWTLPVGLAYSLMMDWYDEKILAKKSNLRGIDAIAATPIIGPALALAGAGDRSGFENAMGMLERTARAGNVYGLGADALNSFSNVIDPTSGQRDFSLDSRVLVFSQFANLRDSIRALIQQDGTMTYQSVGRPLLATMGGSGLLQYQQIANNLFGLDNNEARVTARINVNNWLRAGGREAGLELRAGAGRSSPTPVSVWVREMQLAAYANDRMGFLEAYRNAIEASQKSGEEDPENKVLQAWKSRSPMAAVFAQKPTDTEMQKLMGAMDDTGKRAVREALMLYDNFTELIAPSLVSQMLERRQKAQLRAMEPATADQLRRRAALSAMGGQ